MDVDGTLIFWAGGKHAGVFTGVIDSVNWTLVEALRKWKKEDPGRQLVIWSANGAQHAFMAINYCKIEDIVDTYFAKPDVFVDDRDMRWFLDRKKLIVEHS